MIYPWSAYDCIADIYDEDMGLNNPGQDIEFYMRLAARMQGPILELGCGTGRITLPLMEAGHRVIGLDGSLPMLRQLKKKAEMGYSAGMRRNLQFVCADMRRFSLREKFPLILCPFSGFTYLLERDDQTAALCAIRDHLASGGHFALDLFNHRQEFNSTSDRHIFHDYCRERRDGTFLQRTKTIRKNIAQQTNEVSRRYSFLGKDGTELSSFTTVEKIRHFGQPELKLLLEEHAFAVIEEYGGFRGEAYCKNGEVMVFVCTTRRGQMAVPCRAHSSQE
jgi:SAM-dependent methyltransferase